LLHPDRRLIGCQRPRLGKSYSTNIHQMNHAFPDCGSGACQKLSLPGYDNATIVEYVDRNIDGRISPGPASTKPGIIRCNKGVRCNVTVHSLL
jgi:hypothetical protein